jgi:hypothetical protein
MTVHFLGKKPKWYLLVFTARINVSLRPKTIIHTQSLAKSWSVCWDALYIYNIFKSKIKHFATTKTVKRQLLGLSDTLILAVEIIPKSNIKIVERGKIDTPNTQIDDRSLSWKKTQMISSCLHLIETVYTNYTVLLLIKTLFSIWTNWKCQRGNQKP